MKKSVKKIVAIVAIIIFCIISYFLIFGIEKEKIKLFTEVDLTYFPLDPKEKLNGLFEITEIYFDGDLTRTDKTITSARIIGGRFDFNHSVDSSKQIICVSKNYKGTGYFKSGDLKVNFEFDFVNN